MLLTDIVTSLFGYQQKLFFTCSCWCCQVPLPNKKQPQSTFTVLEWTTAIDDFCFLNKAGARVGSVSSLAKACIKFFYYNGPFLGPLTKCYDILQKCYLIGLHSSKTLDQRDNKFKFSPTLDIIAVLFSTQ